jgi:hypothetical protein
MPRQASQRSSKKPEYRLRRGLDHLARLPQAGHRKRKYGHIFLQQQS